MGPKPSKHGHHKDKYPLSNTPVSTATKSESAHAMRNSDTSNFAVIAVIFNPVKYKTRYDHYQKFETHMSQSGVYLITVECIFESTPHFGLPRQNFEITRAGDRRHIQLIAPSILWMKENLINIAVQRLPQHIEYVAWIDADIEFEVCIKKKHGLIFLFTLNASRFHITELKNFRYFIQMHLMFFRLFLATQLAATSN
jgi:hypothetical protein